MLRSQSLNGVSVFLRRLPVILRSAYSPFIHFQEPQRGAAFNARFRKYAGSSDHFRSTSSRTVLTGALAVSFATVGGQALAQQTQPGQSVELEAIVISGEGEGYNTLVSDSPKQTFRPSGTASRSTLSCSMLTTPSS
ncbi:MAG TPA: hypothetical protein VNQ99_16820 [Xanthobacteraceae bacterium]|nr:hypothetical protein [Xanthobacteraceae bacterium]